MPQLSEVTELAFERATGVYAELVAVQRRIGFVTDLLKVNQTIADRRVWNAEYYRLKIEWTAARKQFEESNNIFFELKKQDGRK